MGSCWKRFASCQSESGWCNVTHGKIYPPLFGRGEEFWPQYSENENMCYWPRKTGNVESSQQNYWGHDEKVVHRFRKMLDHRATYIGGRKSKRVLRPDFLFPLFLLPGPVFLLFYLFFPQTVWNWLKKVPRKIILALPRIPKLHSDRKMVEKK